MGLFSKTSSRSRTRKNRVSDFSELDALREQENALQEKLDNLERFVTVLPEKARQDFDESRNVMPPPDELAEREREYTFNSRLTSHQLRNKRRYQAQNGSLVIMLIVAAVAVLAWAWKIAQTGF